MNTNTIANALTELQAKDPESFNLLQQLARNVHNKELDPMVRLRCAAVLGDICNSITMESLQQELAQLKEPKYEYRWVQGARVKVRVS